MQIEQDAAQMPSLQGAKIVILQAKWYHEHIDKMAEACAQLLKKAGCEPERHILPGSLELPLAAQTLMRHAPPESPYDAVICFGAIMKAETYHFDMIMDMCSRGFTQVMLTEGVPIIMEVVPVSDLSQLVARSQDNNFNKGVEAALAAAEIIAWRRRVLS